jgi:hypothetical protein
MLKPNPKLRLKLALALYLQTKQAGVRASECVSGLAGGIATGSGFAFLFLAPSLCARVSLCVVGPRMTVICI